VPLFQEEGGALGGQLGRDRRRASHSPIPRSRAIAGSAIRVFHRRMWTSRKLNEAKGFCVMECSQLFSVIL